MKKQRGELIGGVVERVCDAPGETLGVWFSAAEGGDEATLEKLARKHPMLIHARHPLKSGSALWLAVLWKRLDAARWLLSHGASANQKEAAADTSPFLHACGSGSLEMVELLLPFADITQKGPSGATGLMMLVAQGRQLNLDRERWGRLAERFNPEDRDGVGNSALSLAVSRGLLAAVEGLLDHLPLLARDRKTAWVSAQRRGEPEVLDTVIVHPKGEELRGEVREAIAAGEMKMADFPRLARFLAQEEAENLRQAMVEALPPQGETPANDDLAPRPARRM